MPSKARRAFDANAKDIGRLLELHKQVGGVGRGRRSGLEVLNKSAIVLITSYWEAYCEDIAAEGLEHIVSHGETADVLPDDLKRQIANELAQTKHELAAWSLSGDGWRSVLRSRLADLRAERNRRLNTPRSSNIDDLFLKALGVKRISESWKWARKMTPTRGRNKLDKYVTLRGEIAHRGQAGISVKKADVVDYFNFISRLAARTGGKVNSHVSDITHKPLWTK